jgi:c(7)-type cytochrome triheme protein
MDIIKAVGARDLGFGIRFALAVLTLGCILGVSVAAQSLPKLPGALKVAKSAESPGQVIFNHETHVDSSKPACTNCHPKEFRILKADAGTRTIRHSDMEKGRQCGACHDGKKAFALTDDCTACHHS